MNQKYIDMVYSENHLEHHGVLGQKWGVENGPPYPLGRDVQSELSNGASYNSLNKAIKSDYKAEKKAIKKESERASREHDEKWNSYRYDESRKITKDYKNNKKIAKEEYKNSIRNAKDQKRNQWRELRSGISNEETRYDQTLQNIQDRNAANEKRYANEKAELKEAKNERLSKALKIAGVAAGVAAVAGVSYLAAKEASKKLDENDREDKGLTRADLARKLSYGQFKNDMDTHRDSIRARSAAIAEAGDANLKYREAYANYNDGQTRTYLEENKRYTELDNAQNRYNNADRYAIKSADKVTNEKAIIKGNANTPSKKLAASLMDKYDRTSLETANKNSTYNIYNPYYDKNVINDRSKKSKR